MRHRGILGFPDLGLKWSSFLGLFGLLRLGFVVHNPKRNNIRRSNTDTHFWGFGVQRFERVREVFQLEDLVVEGLECSLLGVWCVSLWGSGPHHGQRAEIKNSVKASVAVTGICAKKRSAKRSQGQLVFAIIMTNLCA